MHHPPEAATAASTHQKSKSYIVLITASILEIGTAITIAESRRAGRTAPNVAIKGAIKPTFSATNRD